MSIIKLTELTKAERQARMNVRNFYMACTGDELATVKHTLESDGDYERARYVQELIDEDDSAFQAGQRIADRAAAAEPATRVVGRATVAKRKNEWGEYVVRVYDQHGARWSEADYHTDDRTDAIDTAAAMLRTAE